MTKKTKTSPTPEPVRAAGTPRDQVVSWMSMALSTGRQQFFNTARRIALEQPTGDVASFTWNDICQLIQLVWEQHHGWKASEAKYEALAGAVNLALRPDPGEVRINEPVDPMYELRHLLGRLEALLKACPDHIWPNER
jgi:hypothetical protein